MEAKASTEGRHNFYMISMDEVTPTVVILVILIAIAETCGQAALKKCWLEKKWLFFVVAICCYVVVCSLLLKIYDFKDMGIVNAIWSGLSIMLIITSGMILFQEDVNLWDIIGVMFIGIGIFFIFMKGH